MPFTRTNRRLAAFPLGGNMIFLKPSFWSDTAVRAIKTFAQAGVALLSANSIGLLDVDWVNLLSVAGLAAAVSLLTSIASADSVGATEYPQED